MSRSEQNREKERRRREEWKKRRRNQTAAAPKAPLTQPIKAECAVVHDQTVGRTSGESCDSPSLSDRVVALIKPFHDEATSAENYRRLVSMGVAAWNLNDVELGPDVHARLAADAMRQMFHDVIPKIARFKTKEEREEQLTQSEELKRISSNMAFQVMELQLAKMKSEMFPDDKRQIAAYRIEYHEGVAELRIEEVVSPVKCVSN